MEQMKSSHSHDLTTSPPHHLTTIPAVHVEDLTVSYREKPVLWDIDLTVPQGVATSHRHG